MKLHRTAITRKGPSIPARRLYKDGRLQGRVLDYGCGRGTDSEYYGIQGWDPYYRAEPHPSGKYDTILCTYVLCILPPGEESKVISDIEALLKPGGRAYITVRNDIEKEEITSIAWRRPVNLKLAVLYENTKYKTYILGGINDRETK